MAKLGQKEAVIAQVLVQIPDFQKYQDNALLKLTNSQLDDIKSNIFHGIMNGGIEYSKDATNMSECRSYARSMVMNHLKKARELNGGHQFVSKTSDGETKTVRQKVESGPKGINLDLLTEELREVVKSWR